MVEPIQCSMSGYNPVYRSEFDYFRLKIRQRVPEIPDIHAILLAELITCFEYLTDRGLIIKATEVWQHFGFGNAFAVVETIYWLKVYVQRIGATIDDI